MLSKVGLKSVHTGAGMATRQLASMSSFSGARGSACPLNRSSMVYLFYLTLGFTLPFALPYRESSRENDTPAKGRTNPRCVFARLI